MKKLILVVPIIILSLAVCIKPPRDNEYDPNNPNKAALSGTVYDINGNRLPKAVVSLMQDTEVFYADTSAAEGAYAIADIDPGIYKLIARAPYCKPYECDAESLPADTVAAVDICFCEQYYDFESESLGTIQPYGFETVFGNWLILSDSAEPGDHSLPMVYHGNKPVSGGISVSLLTNSAADFFFETKLKVLDYGNLTWATGALFRYSDTLNFYFVAITNTGIALERRLNGVDSTFMATPHSFLTGQWYDLIVEMRGSHIQVLLNWDKIFETDDGSIPNGPVGLWISNTYAAHATSVHFDDVVISR
jgi:hypothetical protein